MEAFRPSGRRYWHLYAGDDPDNASENVALCGVTAPWHDADNAEWEDCGKWQCPKCAKEAEK